MLNSIANLKENLNKIALDVHDDDDDEDNIQIYNNQRTPVSDRRNSHSFANSISVSPLSNGTASPFNSEIEQYKAEIKRLQESEAQIKALSVNYAAILKEKEEQILRLNKENGSLKKNLDSKTALPKGSSDHPINRQSKIATSFRSRSGNNLQNGASPKSDGMSNGIGHASRDDAGPRTNFFEKEKELVDTLQEKNKSLAAIQSTYESQIQKLKSELEKEREKIASIQMRYEEELKSNKSFQEELKLLKSDQQKTYMEYSKVRSELTQKSSEVRRLEMELDGRHNSDSNDIVQSLKRVIATLEKENTDLKKEKNELVSALESRISSSDASVSQSHGKGGKDNLLHNFTGKEELELSIHKLDKDLKEMQRERDKALQQLNRLKQHLLDKESEESEKMDEDSRIIEELRQINEHQRDHISHLESSLKQAIASQEEVKMSCHKEIQQSKESLDDLNKKLAVCMNTIDAKNVELLNLQTALGQYYAEIEAKEHLEADLARARDEAAKISAQLKDADQQAEASKKEKEEILGKLTQNERMLAEWKSRVTKLEDDNAKLRHVLEQSMTRLNRMSTDSDYLVDRRIVIKLLVTYFQRNHSKEVLDLMVRMLGFTDEDKQRIGVAQYGAGKGVVRGVLGIPGRLVGGILGGSSTEARANVAPDSQSFADLWVDFLLKETEERERREMEENAGTSREDTQGRNSGDSTPALSTNRTNIPGRESDIPSRYISPRQNTGPIYSHSNPRLSGGSESEFSNVPLTAESGPQISRLPPRY